MTAAVDQGVLCFAAAGNRGGDALYPARYPDCLAVGAVGRDGFAPAGTGHEYEARQSTRHRQESVFVWRGSAFGSHVKYLAAGLTVPFCRSDGSLGIATGTSFAAPIAAGIAARILENDAKFWHLERTRERVNHARILLAQHGDRLFPTAANHGLLACP